MTEIWISEGATPQIAAEYEELVRSVGVALSSWMAIEAQAQQTFGIAMRSWTSPAARAVFHAAGGTHARLKMTNEAVRAVLADGSNPELSDRWARIFDRAQKLAKRRNLVAHGQASLIDGVNGVDKYARIIDPLGAQEHLQAPSSAGISLDQLTEMTRNFGILAQEMFEHGQALYLHLSQQSAANFVMPATPVPPPSAQ